MQNIPGKLDFLANSDCIKPLIRPTMIAPRHVEKRRKIEKSSIDSFRKNRKDEERRPHLQPARGADADGRDHGWTLSDDGAANVTRPRCSRTDDITVRPFGSCLGAPSAAAAAAFIADARRLGSRNVKRTGKVTFLKIAQGHGHTPNFCINFDPTRRTSKREARPRNNEQEEGLRCGSLTRSKRKRSLIPTHRLTRGSMKSTDQIVSWIESSTPFPDEAISHPSWYQISFQFACCYYVNIAGLRIAKAID